MRKIVHLVSSLNMGGAERLVFNLSIEQARQGMDLRVISYGSETDALYPALSSEGIAITCLQGGLLARQWTVLKALMAADVIHIHSAPVVRSLSPLLPLLASKNLIYVVHGETSPKLKGFRPAMRFANLFLSHIVAVSQPAKLAISQRFAIKPNKIGLIPNGVPLPVTAPTALATSGVIKLGIVGRLIPLKNVGLAIRAVAACAALGRPFELHVYGDGEKREELEALAIQLKAPVIFHGLVLNQKDIFTNINALIIASNTEGLPMVLIEAMTYRTSCISTKVGAIPSLIQPSETGLLFDVGALPQLIRLLEGISANPQSLSEMGEAAYQYAKANYSIGVVATAYQRLY